MHNAFYFFFSSRRRHTRWPRDWSSDVCSSDLAAMARLVFGDSAARAELEGIVLSRVERAVAHEEAKARRSEEHTSELQSRGHLVCRLLLEKKNYRSHKQSY